MDVIGVGGRIFGDILPGRHGHHQNQARPEERHGREELRLAVAPRRQNSHHRFDFGVLYESVCLDDVSFTSTKLIT